MQLVLIICGVIALVAIYLFFGAVLKFIVGWWLLLTAIPACFYVGFAFGWWGAIGAIIGLSAAVGGTNEWQGTSVYLNITQKVDTIFGFRDK
jgi:hypothetical protein